MNENGTKKYPVFTYISWLLAVCVLVSGVSLARFSTAFSSGTPVDIAPFECSYEIENFSSFGFSNNNFWLEGGDSGSESGIPVGTSRTIRFTMRNFTGDRITGVDVQGSMRIYLPAMLADNLALQFRLDSTQGDSDTSAYTTVTPQAVLGELIYDDEGEYVTYSGEQEVYPVTEEGSQYADIFGGYEPLDYDMTGSSWVASGGLSADENGKVSGTVTLTETRVDGSTGMQLTISAGTGELDYSVGFRRGDVSRPLYLDLKRETTFYTIDVTMPSMVLEGGEQNDCTHVAYLTLTEALQNSLVWQDDFEGHITEPSQFHFWVNKYDNSDIRYTNPNDPTQYDTITVIGYHFETEAPLLGSDGKPTDEMTTVRVKCEYESKEDGKTAGTYTVKLYHVAPITENGAHYVHPLTINGTYYKDYADNNNGSSDVTNATELTGVSYSTESLFAPGATATDGSGHTVALSAISTDGDTSSEEPEVIIPNITISPFTDGNSVSKEYNTAISRSYYLRITASFVQVSVQKPAHDDSSQGRAESSDSSQGAGDVLPDQNTNTYSPMRSSTKESAWS